MKCLKCGQDNSANYQYCVTCGTPLTSTPEPSARQSSYTPPVRQAAYISPSRPPAQTHQAPTQQNFTPLVASIIFLGLAILIFVMVFVSKPQQVTDAAETQQIDSRVGDYNACLQRMEYADVELTRAYASAENVMTEEDGKKALQYIDEMRAEMETAIKAADTLLAEIKADPQFAESYRETVYTKARHRLERCSNPASEMRFIERR